MVGMSRAECRPEGAMQRAGSRNRHRGSLKVFGKFLNCACVQGNPMRLSKEELLENCRAGQVPELVGDRAMSGLLAHLTKLPGHFMDSQKSHILV